MGRPFLFVIIPIFNNIYQKCPNLVTVAAASKNISTRNRILQMLEHLKIAVQNKVRLIIVTRPIEDSGTKDRPALQDALSLLERIGFKRSFQNNTHQQFSIIDQRIAGMKV